ncbi:unnamed protein product [Toxocara canis]|uniref:DUF3800 domain-containing protein n=1 Tax=Toxocara canis TaxID=6265 RepID=A0A183VEM0_TOXCA|nr:unnamed protein product [Toxocara canis]
MSLLHIVIDEDSYGCAVVLSTALPVQILSQWIDTVCDKLASVHRLHLSRKNFEQLCIKKWYITRFEIIHISEKNIHSVDDVYDLFFARTVMDEWLCNSDRHSEKRLRKIGSLNDDNHRLISTEELISLNEVSGFILAEKARRDRCMLEFRQYRCNEAVIRWEVLQALSDKYGYGGGRWILTPVWYDDAQESSKNVQCMASELLKC